MSLLNAALPPAGLVSGAASWTVAAHWTQAAPAVWVNFSSSDLDGNRPDTDTSMGRIDQVYPESEVHDVRITQGGTAYTATFFVEHGIISANIAGRIITAPLGNRPAEISVSELLSSYIHQQNRRALNSRRWAGALARHRQTGQNGFR